MDSLRDSKQNRSCPTCLHCCTRLHERRSSLWATASIPQCGECLLRPNLRPGLRAGSGIAHSLAQQNLAPKTRIGGGDARAATELINPRNVSRAFARWIWAAKVSPRPGGSCDHRPTLGSKLQDPLVRG